MSSEKEFGKLSTDQLKRLVRELPEIRKQLKEFPEFLRQRPQKLSELLGVNYHWAAIYEWSFAKQLAFLFVALGLQEKLHETATSPDPQERTLGWTAEGGELDQWFDANEEDIEKKHLIWLAIVASRNVLSIMLYYCSMGDLVARVREGKEGADDAFFKAVRVDRSVLACPTFADRLARAELTNDQTFFLHLRSALKGPSKRHWEALNDLRYTIVLLREIGFDALSDAQLEDLFVDKLKLYPKHPSARKNLRKHLYEARKVSTTVN